MVVILGVATADLGSGYGESALIQRDVGRQPGMSLRVLLYAVVQRSVHQSGKPEEFSWGTDKIRVSGSARSGGLRKSNGALSPHLRRHRQCEDKEEM